MDRSLYRWVIVAAGGLLGCVAIGAMFALPVFLTPMASATGWSRTGISSAMTIGFLAMAFASIGWGAIADRFGARIVVLLGSLLLALSLVLASRSSSLIEFQLVFGLLAGGAVAAVFAPMMAAVTGWFDTHRSLAVSLVSAGMGMAPLTMSPLAAWLISKYDWRTAYLLIAATVVVLMVPLSLLVRRPPASAQAAVADIGADPPMSVGAALRSPQLIILMLTNFCCCATHSGPIFHTVSYAMSCGIPAITAVSIYSLEGLAGMGGRLTFGVLGDTFGAKNVLVCGLLVQALGALAYAFVRELDGFYAVAGAVRLHLRRCDAALRGHRTREFSVAHDGHHHWRHVDGRRAGDGSRTDSGRLGLRHLRNLFLALRRLVRDRDRIVPDCVDVQAVSAGAISGGVAGGVRRFG